MTASVFTMQIAVDHWTIKSCYEEWAVRDVMKKYNLHVLPSQAESNSLAAGKNIFFSVSSGLAL